MAQSRLSLFAHRDSSGGTATNSELSFCDVTVWSALSFWRLSIKRGNHMRNSSHSLVGSYTSCLIRLISLAYSTFSENGLSRNLLEGHHHCLLVLHARCHNFLCLNLEWRGPARAAFPAAGRRARGRRKVSEKRSHLTLFGALIRGKAPQRVRARKT